ncbi:MAG: hypothetical protein AAB410_04985 [Patescibacteria group bacterium]
MRAFSEKRAVGAQSLPPSRSKGLSPNNKEDISSSAKSLPITLAENGSARLIGGTVVVLSRWESIAASAYASSLPTGR